MISATKLSYTYPKSNKTAVKEISFDIHEGEIFGFGGLAGQGKIGIANGIMGLFDTQGDVYAFGKRLDLSKLGEALRNDIAFVSSLVTLLEGIGLSAEQLLCSSVPGYGIPLDSDIYEFYHPQSSEPGTNAATMFGWSAALFIDLALDASRDTQIP